MESVHVSHPVLHTTGKLQTPPVHEAHSGGQVTHLPRSSLYPS